MMLVKQIIVNLCALRKLKSELLETRRKGAKRGSGNYSERSCGRCQEPMGLLTSNGSQCRACKHQVCRKCQSVRPNGSWVCTVCAKEMWVCTPCFLISFSLASVHLKKKKPCH